MTLTRIISRRTAGSEIGLALLISAAAPAFATDPPPNSFAAPPSFQSPLPSSVPSAKLPVKTPPPKIDWRKLKDLLREDPEHAVGEHLC